MSATYLSKNPMLYSKSKQVNVKYHWIHKKLEEELFLFEKVHTNDNESDMMTKSLPMMKLESCRRKVSMIDFPKGDLLARPISCGAQLT